MEKQIKLLEKYAQNQGLSLLEWIKAERLCHQTHRAKQANPSATAEAPALR